MADREKVLRGLEICKLGHCDYKCPYAVINLGCKNQLNDDAISIIKEQEPRILDWDEIKNYSVVYGEFRDVKEIYPLIITVDDWGRCLSWNP